MCDAVSGPEKRVKKVHHHQGIPLLLKSSARYPVFLSEPKVYGSYHQTLLSHEKISSAKYQSHTL